MSSITSFSSSLTSLKEVVCNEKEPLSREMVKKIQGSLTELASFWKKNPFEISKEDWTQTLSVIGLVNQKQMDGFSWDPLSQGASAVYNFFIDFCDWMLYGDAKALHFLSSPYRLEKMCSKEIDQLKQIATELILETDFSFTKYFSLSFNKIERGQDKEACMKQELEKWIRVKAQYENNPEFLKAFKNFIGKSIELFKENKEFLSSLTDYQEVLQRDHQKACVLKAQDEIQKDITVSYKEKSCFIDLCKTYIADPIQENFLEILSNVNSKNLFSFSSFVQTFIIQA